MNEFNEVGSFPADVSGSLHRVVILFSLPKIMEQCGDQDVSSLSLLRKRDTGLSPPAYRKAYTVSAPRQWWRMEDADGLALLARYNVA